MPVNPALAITIPASRPHYRITAISFNTPNPVHHKKVVNGMGARKSHNGAHATTTAARFPFTWRTRSKRALPRKCSISIEKRSGGLTQCTCL